jgi:hypothetical protein
MVESNWIRGPTTLPAKPLAEATDGSPATILPAPKLKPAQATATAIVFIVLVFMFQLSFYPAKMPGGLPSVRLALVLFYSEWANSHSFLYCVQVALVDGWI